MRAALTTAVAAALAMLAAAPPAAADDLIYRYRPSQHLSVLKAYSQQPYWHMLAECAGIYGALVNRYQATGQPGRADAAKAEGVSFLNLATSRLARDRGIARDEALKLAATKVEAGRASAEQMLSEKLRDRQVSHEQVIELFCSQISDAHASAERFARR